MSNHDDLFARAKALDIYQVLLPYCPDLKKEAGGYAGPCPICGGNNRFSITTRKNCCHCRKECGISGDTVTAWAKIRGISNLEAARELVGEASTPKEWTPARVEFTPPAPEIHWHEPEWQLRAQNILKSSHSEADKQVAEQYLALRGIDWPDIVESFELGHRMVWNPSEKKEMLAIVIPWYQDGKICHIKYRFLGSDRLRFSSLKGGEPILFGTNVPATASSGILSEGELNAISIKQTIKRLHSWSVGAQGNEQGVKAAVELALQRKIQWMLVFFDEYEYAARAKQAFIDAGIPCAAVCSQFGDANDILCEKGEEWLLALIEHTFNRIKSICDRCADMKTLRYMTPGVYQICPDCGGKPNE